MTHSILWSPTLLPLWLAPAQLCEAEAGLSRLEAEQGELTALLIEAKVELAENKGVCRSRCCL